MPLQHIFNDYLKNVLNIQKVVLTLLWNLISEERQAPTRHIQGKNTLFQALFLFLRAM